MMRMVVLGTIAAVLIAAVIGFEHQATPGSSSLNRTADDRDGGGGSEPEPTKTQVKSPFSNGSPVPFTGSVTAGGSPSDRASNSIVTPQPKEELPFDRAQQTNAEPARTEEVDPRSVIGRSFRVSASVRAACRSFGCPYLDQDLAKFVQEPRDPQWSGEVEATLQDLVESEPGKYAIRDIECRTSICMVEVASIYGQFPAVAYRTLDSAYQSGAEFGIERDVSSAKTTVTVITFNRR